MSLPSGIQDICDLTPLQQGMLFHSLYAPEATVYLIQIDLTLEGDLDADALERAWQMLAERHVVLRASFLWEQMERPFQLIHRQVDLHLARLDWRGISADEQTSMLNELVQEDRAKGFDLTRPPLTRLTLIDFGAGLWHLVWTFHHIIIEGWSSSILLAELWRIYAALRAGSVPQLPAAPSYLDYLRWLKSQDVAKTEAYWRTKLKGFRTPTRLPIDRADSDRPADVHTVELCDLRLPDALHQAVRDYARSQRLTLNTVLQGIWAILLSRYTREPDVAYGAVVSGRPSELPGVDAIVGLFVNTLPARIYVDPQQPVGDWLRALQLDQAEMRQYEHSSLMQVQSWSDVSAGQPLFFSVMAFENWLDAPAQQIDGGAVRVTGRTVHEESDQPLTFFVTFHRGLTLSLMFDVERLQRPTIERILGHCQTLLEGMVANPGARIGDLPLLTAPERKLLLEDWNATDYDYPRHASIKLLFEEQAARSPDAVAVEQEGTSLTYAELNSRANQLAHALIRLSIGPESMVGILMRRSPDMLVGLLGILKAGAAYVPLDPDYPAARLRFMVEDTTPPVLLISAAERANVPPCTARLLAVDEEWPEISRESRDNPDVEASGSSLAYVMYTSGSTGQPKGACVEQRSIVRLVRAGRFMDLKPETVFLQYSPVSFDAATLEIWGSLLNGGRLVLAPAGVLSLDELGKVITRSGVNSLWLTSTLFHQMVNEQLDSLRGLKYLLSGGDVISVPHVRKTLYTLGDVTLINAYGPTENTTFTTCHILPRDKAISGSVSIGRPIGRTKVYVLDEALHPVPIGVAGELYTGGDGLARGYLNRPDLTAARFVPDPFADFPGARLYRTGDLVRWREDGSLEFVARMDHQVKVRGFRVEPGEIDIVLGQHSLVREAVTIVREDVPGDKRLVSYLTCKPDTQVTADELRRHLRATLPEFMLPAAFVMLDALPVTANGKVDRAALPAPEGGRQVGTTFVAPQTELETLIATAWREGLRVDQVGLDDNFFDLGGNSMLLMRVHSKLKHAIGNELQLMDLFRFPTIRALAQHFSQTDVGDEAARFDSVRERARRRREAGRRAAPTSTH